MGGTALDSAGDMESARRSFLRREVAVKFRVAKVLGVVLVAGLALLIAPGRMSAHHGSSIYDISKTISVKGTVTEFEFINPHSAIHLESKDDKGNVEQWLVEADSPNNLSRAGWTRNSIKPGDQVTIFGNRAKDGSKVMRLRKVVFSDGRELKPREGDDY
jgi:DNA/RNA endonuclease YhcR with UshA esterase domain